MRTAIRLGIGLLLALSVAGCAQQEGAQATGKQARASGPDFSRDNDANFAASQMGQLLLQQLPALPGYAGLQIVSYGIEVDVVGDPSAAIRTAVERDTRQYKGTAIPVHYRKVLNTEKDLKAVADRIVAAWNDWAKQGIRLTSVYIDLASNTVRIDLSHYTPAYRNALIAAYGNRVTVTPEDVNAAGD